MGIFGNDIETYFKQQGIMKSDLEKAPIVLNLDKAKFDGFSILKEVKSEKTDNGKTRVTCVVGSFNSLGKTKEEKDAITKRIFKDVLLEKGERIKVETENINKELYIYMPLDTEKLQEILKGNTAFEFALKLTPIITERYKNFEEFARMKNLSREQQMELMTADYMDEDLNKKVSKIREMHTNTAEQEQKPRLNIQQENNM